LAVITLSEVVNDTFFEKYVFRIWDFSDDDQPLST